MNRKVREQEYQNELNILSTENNKLHEENKNLETNLSQIQGLRETIVEMEHNLKELKLKLQSEENEKKQWQSKYDEVSKKQVLEVLALQVLENTVFVTE